MILIYCSALLLSPKGILNLYYAQTNSLKYINVNSEIYATCDMFNFYKSTLDYNESILLKTVFTNIIYYTNITI